LNYSWSWTERIVAEMKEDVAGRMSLEFDGEVRHEVFVGLRPLAGGVLFCAVLSAGLG
jgi:hypothetical protein